MTETLQIYKCPICGNIVDVLHSGGGTLVCCGKPMLKMEAGTTDASTEKHVPMITKKENGFLVTVGEVEHPMEQKHYIEWIEIIADGKSYRHFLSPGNKPQAFFCVDAKNVIAREYCNLHGLWQKEV